MSIVSRSFALPRPNPHIRTSDLVPASEEDGEDDMGPDVACSTGDEDALHFRR